MSHGIVQSQKTNIKNVHEYPIKKIQYTAPYFGFQNIQTTGKYVRLAIIDSGVPLHKDIPVDIYKSSNFTSSGSSFDVFGHSTSLTGVIAANGKSGIKGLAPEADLYFAKTLLDSDGTGVHEAVIDALLWCIVRDVDIILMSFGSPFEHDGLRDAIRKVNKSGISMFAAGGNCTSRTRDMDFPARYDEVFSVGYSNKISSNEVIKHAGKSKGIIFPSQEFETTFVDSRFVTVSGSSLCAAAVAGIGVLSYHYLRSKGFDIKNPQVLYNEIGRLAIKE